MMAAKEKDILEPSLDILVIDHYNIIKAQEYISTRMQQHIKTIIRT